ncbi:MAG: peptidylprolyl isomerase [Nostocaceae cyanobacterium]|nr:peptidylprolyl isomerase [Nostocaceae cyanobacterium]
MIKVTESYIHPNPDEIVSFLKKNISLKNLWQQVLFQKVIDKAAQERGITVTAEEIQAEADRVRRENRLEKAADTLAWLADQMITPEDWETGIRELLLQKKLSATMFAGEVEKFFAQNSLDFEQILLYQIIVPSQKIAQELFYQIEESEISFYEAAHLYDIDENRRQQCGFDGRIYRFALKPDIASVVFSAKLKEVIGPVQSEQGYHLFMVAEFIPAELTPERSQEIMGRMFQDWLAAEVNYMLHSS